MNDVNFNDFSAHLEQIIEQWYLAPGTPERSDKPGKKEYDFECKLELSEITQNTASMLEDLYEQNKNFPQLLGSVSDVIFQGFEKYPDWKTPVLSKWITETSTESIQASNQVTESDMQVEGQSKKKTRVNLCKPLHRLFAIATKMKENSLPNSNMAPQSTSNAISIADPDDIHDLLNCEAQIQPQGLAYILEYTKRHYQEKAKQNLNYNLEKDFPQEIKALICSHITLKDMIALQGSSQPYLGFVDQELTVKLKDFELEDLIILNNSSKHNEELVAVKIKEKLQQTSLKDLLFFVNADCGKNLLLPEIINRLNAKQIGCFETYEFCKNSLKIKSIKDLIDFFDGHYDKVEYLNLSLKKHLCQAELDQVAGRFPNLKTLTVHGTDVILLDEIDSEFSSGVESGFSYLSENNFNSESESDLFNEPGETESEFSGGLESVLSSDSESEIEIELKNKFNFLTTLELDPCNQSLFDNIVEKCPNLQTLEISWSDLSNFEALTHLPFLTEIKMSNPQQDFPIDISELNQCLALQTLTITEGDIDFSVLENHPTLQTLRLQSCTNMHTAKKLENKGIKVIYIE